MCGLIPLEAGDAMHSRASIVCALTVETAGVHLGAVCAANGGTVGCSAAVHCVRLGTSIVNHGRQLTTASVDEPVGNLI